MPFMGLAGRFEHSQGPGWDHTRICWHGQLEEPVFPIKHKLVLPVGSKRKREVRGGGELGMCSSWLRRIATHSPSTCTHTQLETDRSTHARTQPIHTITRTNTKKDTYISKHKWQMHTLLPAFAETRQML